MTAQPGAVYAEQIEQGKKIVRDLLATLASTLKQSRITGFSFFETSQDFDRNQVSLVESEDHNRIIVKLEVKDLADAPATAQTRRKLEQIITEAVTEYCKR